MPLRTILFDLGNVLVNFSHDRMYDQIAQVCRRSPEDLKEFVSVTRLMQHYEEGRISDQVFHGSLEAWTGDEIDPEELRRAASDIFWLNSPMDEIVSTLKESGLRLVLLSNTVPVHIEHVRRAWPILDAFDELVLSCEVGAMKPRPEIFQAALAAIQCRPNECLYTDDIPEYVAAGRTFGLNAEVFQGPDRFLGHLRDHGWDSSK